MLLTPTPRPRRHREPRRLPARALALGLACLALALALPPPTARAEADDQLRLRRASIDELVGMTGLEALEAGRVPTGRGVVMGHVEADAHRYLPNADNPRFEGVEFIDRTGAGRAAGHAQMTAAVLYGPRGLAPGVSRVHCYASRHWLGPGHLRTGSPRPPHRREPRVFTHSWVGSDSDHASEILRRLDLVIHRDDVVMCVGVNNDDTPVPALLASSYNAIAVGSAADASSRGPTRLETAGRSKPDLVGPRGPTSSTTPMVAAAAARLLEAIDALGDRVPARQHSELVKALLMTGATKPAGWDNDPDDPATPLDPEFGAGIVHLRRSLEILHAGRATPHAPRARGWAVRVKRADDRAVYRFHIDEPVDEIAISMTWHRGIEAGQGFNVAEERTEWRATPHLPRFHLALYRESPDDRPAPAGRELVAASTSDIDNVQHLHLEDAPAGRYDLELTRQPGDAADHPWAYALAWRFD